MVLREAARAFVENGFVKTSIDEIARRLGVTKPTIYHYVGNKEAIILECLKYGAKGLDVLLDALDEQPMSGLERLREFFKAYSEGVANDFSQCLVAIDVKQLKPETKKYYGQARKRLINLVQEMVQSGIDDGSIRPQNPTITAYAIIGAFNFIPQWFSQEGLSSDEIFEGFDNFISQGLAP